MVKIILKYNMGQTACILIKFPLKENMVQTELFWSKFSKNVIYVLSYSFLTKTFLYRNISSRSNQIKAQSIHCLVSVSFAQINGLAGGRKQKVRIF